MQNHKVAVVTGAGRGIGRCIALGLADDGYRVALMARTESELEETAQQIQDRVKPSAEVTIIRPTDVSSPTQIAESFEAIMERWGRVDAVINNAGQYIPGTLDLSADAVSQLIDVNLKGALSVAQAAGRIMRTQKSGYLFNISSLCGVHGFAGVGAYCATKFGLMGLNESLFRELLPFGVKVTALCPSWVDTQMAEGSTVAREDMIQPEDLLATVRFLLSLSAGAAVREMVVECTSTPT